MTGSPFKGAVCRGSWLLGSACGKCERCAATRPQERTAPITGEDPTFDTWAAVEAWEKDRVAKCCALGPHALNPVGLLLATADRINRVRAAHAHLAPVE